MKRLVNGKKNDDDADANSKRDNVKLLNGQTNIYSKETMVTRRHYVGSAN